MLTGSSIAPCLVFRFYKSAKHDAIANTASQIPEISTRMPDEIWVVVDPAVVVLLVLPLEEEVLTPVSGSVPTPPVCVAPKAEAVAHVLPLSLELAVPPVPTLDAVSGTKEVELDKLPGGYTVRFVFAPKPMRWLSASYME